MLAQNRHNEAEKLFNEAYRVLSATMGDQDISTIYVINNLAGLRLARGKPAGVAELLEKAVANIDRIQARAIRMLCGSARASPWPTSRPAGCAKPRR